MMIFMYCLLLPFATMVVTTTIRAQRENVLSFLNDAIGSTTEKTIPATVTAFRSPREEDSEDMSEAKSTESFDTNGFTDAFKDLDSHEISIPKDKAPSRRKTGVDKDSMGPKDVSSSLVWDQGSREHSGPQGVHQTSRERTGFNSKEGMMVDAQEAESLSGKHIFNSDSNDHQRRERVTGLNGMLATGGQREPLDWDSLEENNGRPAPGGNGGEADYDETREFISSETYPVARPEHMPSRLSVPAKSRTS